MELKPKVISDPTSYVNDLLSRQPLQDGLPLVTDELLAQIPINYVGNIRICTGLRIRFRSSTTNTGVWELASDTLPRLGLPSYPHSTLLEVIARRNIIYAEHFGTHAHHYPMKERPSDNLNKIVPQMNTIQTQLSTILHVLGTTLVEMADKIDPSAKNLAPRQNRLLRAEVTRLLMQALSDHPLNDATHGDAVDK